MIVHSSNDICAGEVIQLHYIFTNFIEILHLSLSKTERPKGSAKRLVHLFNNVFNGCLLSFACVSVWRNEDAKRNTWKVRRTFIECHNTPYNREALMKTWRGATRMLLTTMETTTRTSESKYSYEAQHTKFKFSQVLIADILYVHHWKGLHGFLTLTARS